MEGGRTTYKKIGYYVVVDLRGRRFICSAGGGKS